MRLGKTKIKHFRHQLGLGNNYYYNSLNGSCVIVHFVCSSFIILLPVYIDYMLAGTEQGLWRESK